jgi:hypothetical protein
MIKRIESKRSEEIVRMADDLKTKPTSTSPASFIDKVESERKRQDSHELVAMMQTITGKPPQMWGTSIIGFGKYYYKYESGRDGEMLMTGFSPRKQSLVLYLGPGLDDKKLTSKLGKHKVGKGCLYINKLDDIDRNVLQELVTKSVAEMRNRYQCE